MLFWDVWYWHAFSGHFFHTTERLGLLATVTAAAQRPATGCVLVPELQNRSDQPVLDKGMAFQLGMSA